MNILSANQVARGWLESFKAWLYNFFNPQLDDYVNFDFGKGEMLNLRLIVFGAFFGVLLASLYIIYIKNVVGAFVRKLLAEECLSEERAMTLEQLGFWHNPFVRLALKGSVTLGTVYSVYPEEQGSAESVEGGLLPNEKADAPSKNSPQATKPDPRRVRYYIKEEKKHAAEMRFNPRGSGWPTFFFVLVISVICVILIFALLPHVLSYLDKTVSVYTEKGNILR